MVLRVNSASDPGLTLNVSITSQLGDNDAEGPFLLTPLLVLGMQDKDKAPGGQSPARSGSDTSSLVMLSQHGHPGPMAQSQAAWPSAPDRLCLCLASWAGQLQAGSSSAVQGLAGQKGSSGLAEELGWDHVTAQGAKNPGEGMTLAQGVPGL